MASAAPHPFRIANFRYYWAARLTATLAQGAMMLIIGWQVYNIARADGLGVAAASARLGLIGLIQFLPLFALTPVTGWVADRIDRRQIARATIALQVLCAAALAYATWTGTVDLLILYSVAFLLGIARAFSGPALGALAPNLVPRESLPNAIALSSISWQAGMVAGPGLGGYLYAWVPEASYTGAALLFLVSLACLFLIGPVPRPRSTAAATRSARWSTASLMSAPTGWCSPRSPSISSPSSSPERPRSSRLCPRHPPGRAGGARPARRRARARGDADRAPLLLPAAQDQCRHQDARRGDRLRDRDHRLRPVDLDAAVARRLFVVGASDMFSVYVRQSLIQLSTPDAMRGRVGAVSQLTISASNELGEAESGFLAALVGPVAAVVAGGVGAIAVTLLWVRWYPELRQARTFESPEEPERKGATG
jgi:hypothetical protein